MLDQDNFSTFFFFNDTATTEIYTLSLHDALPILPDHHALRRNSRVIHSRQVQSVVSPHAMPARQDVDFRVVQHVPDMQRAGNRSEEHTSELQSRLHLVCRLLLEKKK